MSLRTEVKTEQYEILIPACDRCGTDFLPDDTEGSRGLDYAGHMLAIRPVKWGRERYDGKRPDDVRQSRAPDHSLDLCAICADVVWGIVRQACQR